jgi:NAD(P)-dependent dehydrogenase (short-subunit alcohol dehydrogenase family)
LIAEGARVAVCGRDESRLASASEHLGPGALCVRADVTISAELATFVDRALDQFGRLDGVVSNAGQSAARPVALSSDDEWRADYELKVIPAVALARRCVEPLSATSGSAKAPDANSTPTAASRAAGLALTKSLAAELGPKGVRANAILIGLIESGQWVRRAEQSNMELDAFYDLVLSMQSIPLGRFGRAEEFAALAAFVLSPRASYLSGVGINLDGGLSPVV